MIDLELLGLEEDFEDFSTVDVDEDDVKVEVETLLLPLRDVTTLMSQRFRFLTP